MSSKRNPIPEFPLKEFKAEIYSDHDKFKTSVKQVVQKLIDQNPKLMNLKVDSINEIKISLVLGTSPPEGTLKEYLQQVQSDFYKKFCDQIEKVAGQPVSLDDMDILLTLPRSDINRLDNLWCENRIEMVKEMRRSLLAFVNKSIPESQTVRPDIQLGLYLPDHRGAQMIIYAESKGEVLVDKIIKPQTVTLDTNVVREWWEDRGKIEYVGELLELGQKLKIDLAVTSRISDDIPENPLANRINELPNLCIREIGSVIRFGRWQVGIDVAGNDEFMVFFRSSAVTEKLNRMNTRNRPDWRDWDHLHTHYRYKRDYFLTWDKGILHFSNELQKKLGIIVMKPEIFMDKYKQSSN